MGRTIVAFSADDVVRLRAARSLRFEVFCLEQGVAADLELDGCDGVCVHFLLYDGDAPIATARARPIAAGTCKLERMAVRRVFRGKGAGRSLMAHVLNKMHEDGVQDVVLHAQTAVEEFYRRLGFAGEGDIYLEAGIPHRTMRRSRA